VGGYQVDNMDFDVGKTHNSGHILNLMGVIGVDPARVRGSGPSWNFASEGPPLFGPSQNVWSMVV